MKVGLILAPYEGALDGRDPTWPDIRELATIAEASGYASVWLPDHQLIRLPDATIGTWDAPTMMAGLAATTTEIELGFYVLCTAFRNPFMTAKVAVTLDEMSAGRLVLGLGAGWHEADFRALGLPFDRRGDRFEEALRIIVPLLRDGQVDFVGEHHQARDAELRLRGPRPGGPPIMIGTSAPSSGARARRLTAEFADWHNDWMRTPDVVERKVAEVDAACAAAGRDPSTLVRTAGVVVLETPAGETGPRAPAQIPLADIDAWIEALGVHARAGIDHLQVAIEPPTRRTIEAFRPVIEALRAA